MTETLEPEVQKSATTDQPRSVADELRRMADWLDAHPGAESELMYAQAQKNRKPQIKLFKLAPLAAAFPGRKCISRRCDDCDVYSLTDDGIVFEVWERSEPEAPKETEITL